MIVPPARIRMRSASFSASSRSWVGEDIVVLRGWRGGEPGRGTRAASAGRTRRLARPETTPQASPRSRWLSRHPAASASTQNHASPRPRARRAADGLDQVVHVVRPLPLVAPCKEEQPAKVEIAFPHPPLAMGRREDCNTTPILALYRSSPLAGSTPEQQYLPGLKRTSSTPPKSRWFRLASPIRPQQGQHLTPPCIDLLDTPLLIHPPTHNASATHERRSPHPPLHPRHPEPTHPAHPS